MKTYKEFMKQFQEEITNNTSGVAGTGEDSDTVIVRKKHDRKKKRKDAAAVLKRVFPNKF
jgi:hypothetical protein